MIDIQTIGGAIITGTHGQATTNTPYCGSLADIIEELTYIDSDGNYYLISNQTDIQKTIQSESGNIIISLKLKFHKIIKYDLFKKINNIADYDILSMYESYPHFKSWYYPTYDIVNTHHTMISKNDLEMYDTNNKCKSDMNPIVDNYLNKIPISANPTLERFRDNKPIYNQTLQKLFCNGTPVKQINFEICVKLDIAKEVFAYIQHIDIIKELHYPIIIRPLGITKTSLYWNGPKIFFGFVYYINDQILNDYSNGLNLIKIIEQKLIDKYYNQILPHRGKFYTPV